MEQWHAPQDPGRVGRQWNEPDREHLGEEPHRKQPPPALLRWHPLTRHLGCPQPRIDWGSGGGGPYGGSCRGKGRGANCVNFDPPCTEGDWNGLPFRKIDATAPGDDVEGYCSGDWTAGRIVDEVLIPKDLPKGDW